MYIRKSSELTVKSHSVESFSDHQGTSKFLEEADDLAPGSRKGSRSNCGFVNSSRRLEEHLDVEFVDNRVSG
jgi:hypothetical protein